VTQRVRGTVINVHAFGATVRLENGEVASVPIADVNANRGAYSRAFLERANLPFDAHAVSSSTLGGKKAPVLLMLAKTRIDEPNANSAQPSDPHPEPGEEHFEQQIALYLKETQEWERADLPPAHERHFLKKKRRAAFFESRHSKER